MINEAEAKELVVKLQELQKRSKKDSSLEPELRKHQTLCIQKLKYLVTMKMGKYKNFSNYEDLLQEGYEALLKGINTYDPNNGGNVFWWLHRYIDTRISRSANLHTTIRYPLKVAKEQTPHKEMTMPHLTEQYNCPDLQLENAEHNYLLQNAMEHLTESQKKVISMVFGLEQYKACSINKIAKETNFSRTNVLKEYKQAINTLKQHIKP